MKAYQSSGSLGWITVLQAYIYFPRTNDRLSTQIIVCHTIAPMQAALMISDPGRNHVVSLSNPFISNLLVNDQFRTLDMASSALVAQSVYYYLVNQRSYIYSAALKPRPSSGPTLRVTTTSR